jgi:hypothetical protein
MYVILISSYIEVKWLLKCCYLFHYVCIQYTCYFNLFLFSEITGRMWQGRLYFVKAAYLDLLQINHMRNGLCEKFESSDEFTCYIGYIYKPRVSKFVKVLVLILSVWI